MSILDHGLKRVTSGQRISRDKLTSARPLRVSSSLLLIFGERNTKHSPFVITMMIGQLPVSVETINSTNPTVKSKNGLDSTTLLHKILLSNANNTQADTGQPVPNVKMRNGIQRMNTSLTFTTMINTLNRSQLIQVTLLVLLVMEVKYSS